MASDGFVQVDADSVGKKIDTEETSVGANTVERQRVIIVPGVTPTGCQVAHKVSASGNNATNVKNAPGQVYGFRVFNKGGVPVYVKLYDKSSTPDPTSDAVALTVGVQAGLSDSDFYPLGIAFASGIGYAIVQGISDTDNTSVGAGDCVFDLLYV